MNRPRWLKLENLFFIFVLIILNTLSAIAGPNRTTYQAKIIKPDGYPLEAANVNFKFTILDTAGTCILYSETYSSVNMAGTGGLISFALGSGVKTYPVSATTFEDVFSNITPSLSCDAGGPGSISPGPNDSRKIVMQFHDGNGWQTLPAMSINAVPYAMFANEAQKLNGKSDTDFVQVSTLPMTCTASEALHFNGAAFSCLAVGGGGTAVTSGSVITALGYTPADGASITALNSGLNSTNTNVSSLSSSVSTLATGLFSVSTTVASLQNSVTNLSSVVANQGVSITALANDLALVSATAQAAWVAANAVSSTANNALLAANAVSSTVNGLSSTVTNLSSSMASVVSSQWLTSGTLLTYNTGGIFVSGGVRVGVESSTCTSILAGTLRYNGGAVEYCNGSSWSAFGVSGAGLTLLNGSASNTQSFVFGNAGLSPAISTNNGLHTFNIPYAASAGVTAGLLSFSDFTTFANKMNATSGAIISALGYTPADAATLTTLSSTVASVSSAANAAQTTANTVSSTVSALALTVNSVSSTVNSLSSIVAGKITSSAASIAQVLGYVPAVSGASVSSQWNTSGTTINYLAGNVGIGTASPTRKLEVWGGAAVAAFNGSSSNHGYIEFYTDMNNPTSRTGYLGYPTSGSRILNLYSQYVSGSVQLQNVAGLLHLAHNGLVGISTQAPSARLHIVSSTASAASLKIDAGVLLATPQAGAIEYDGANLYYTDSSNTRRMLAGSTSSGTVDASNLISSGNITMTPTGSVVVSSTTASTNHNSGALIVNGGAGVAGNLNVNGAIAASSSLTLFNSGTFYLNASSGSPNDPGDIVFRNFDGTERSRIYSGTSASGSLVFAVGPAATTRMTILESGTVGIGTTTPTAALEISRMDPVVKIKNSGGDVGGMYFQNSANSAYIGMYNPSVGSSFGVVTPGLSKAFIGFDSAGRLGSVTNTFTTGTPGVAVFRSIFDDGFGNMGVASAAPNGTRLAVKGAGTTSATMGLHVTDSSNNSTLAVLNDGNIGVGIAAPVVPLHMYGAADILNGNLMIQNYQGGSQRMFKFGVGVRPGFNTFISEDTTASIVAGGGSNMHLAFGNRTGETMRIDNNGNVGIGTVSPTTILDIYQAASPTLRIRSVSNDASSGPTIRLTEDLSENGAVIRYHSLNNSLELGVVENAVENMPFTIGRSTGRVGIGVTSASARLHLGAGNASAAPLKLTSGTLLPTAQAGSIEFDGFDFYVTDGAGVRRALASESTPGVVEANSINSSGNITITPTSSVIVSSTLASTNSTTGALVVRGGLGVAGNINSAGNIQGVSITATSGMLTPYLVGSTVSGGSLTLEASSNAGNGSILLNPRGGKVAIGTSTAVGTLQIEDANIPGIQIKKTGAAGIDTMNFINDMDATGSFWLARGTNAVSAAGSDLLLKITNEGVYEFHGQQVATGNDKSGIIAIKTESAAAGGNRNEGSLEFYTRNSNLDDRTGYVGFETNSENSGFNLSVMPTYGYTSLGALASESVRVTSSGLAVKTQNPIHGVGLHVNGTAIIGTGNTTFPNYSNYVLGYSNTMGGTYRDGGLITVVGASNNFITSFAGYNWNTTVVGRNNTVSGAGYVNILGYNNNVTTGSFSTVVGEGNSSTAISGFIFGNNVTNSIANSLQMGMANTAKITILGAAGATQGNTGVNTTNPKAVLSVVDNTSATTVPSRGSATNAQLHLTNSNEAQGLIAGVLSDGTSYIQSQNTGGVAQAYDLLLQPNGGNFNVGMNSQEPLGSEFGGRAHTVLGTSNTLLYMDNLNIKARIFGDFNQVGRLTASSAASYVNYYILGASNTLNASWSYSNRMALGFNNTVPDGNGTSIVLGSNITTAPASAVTIGMGSPTLTVLASGVVGVGTTAPAYKFEVVGGAKLAGTNGSYIYTERPDSDIDIWQNTGSTKRALSIHAAQSGGDVVNFYANNAGSYNLALGIKNTTGNVGIGISNPNSKLSVAGDITPDTTATKNIGSTTYRWANIYLSNAPDVSSDIRLKKDVKNSDLGLDFVNSLRAVSWTWKDAKQGNTEHYGVIAQETEAAITKAKGKNSENVIVTHNKESDSYSVRYTELISPIIKAIQELYYKFTGIERQIASVEKENADLKARVEKTEKENEELKKRLDKIEKALQKKQ